MNEILQKALDAITAAQPKDEGPVWMCGEQLKDILRDSPQLAQIVLDDFAADRAQLVECEEKIREHATKHGCCCTPKAADGIIREHFGLGSSEDGIPAPEKMSNALDFDSFF